MTRSNVLIIGGPTASGKSGLALAVARAQGGVVINADSMQVYAGLPLLTAQPSAADHAAAPHKLYGTLTPEDPCSAARWRDMALQEIDNALAAGTLPIIVGGTGFYISALLEGLSPIPDIPPEFREKAIARQRELGNPRFNTELAARDPETAAKLDPFNTQRNVRAWEVLEATGKGLAYWQSLPREAPPAHLRFITVTLLPPRETLYAQCDHRFTAMLAAGALAEARAFRDATGGRMDLSIAKALGYADLVAHLDGAQTLDEATASAQQATRHYAKRQMTWFHHQIKPDLALETPDAGAVANILRTTF